jgi:nitrogen fixation NifU-like protein
MEDKDTNGGGGDYVFGELSDRFLEHASHYDHAGMPENYDATGASTGECGDTVQFFLSARAGRVTEARFLIDGCMNTLACANAVVFLVGGKSVAAAWEITEDTVIEELGGIPEGHRHCAELAAGALYKTLRNLAEVEKDPLEKMYRKR